MIPLAISQGKVRPILLGFGLMAVSVAELMVAAVSQTEVIVIDRELQDFWRTTYDILVRPEGARSPIEERYGLVEANHLSGVWGGISFEQYEAIRSIPGVELAAPIAMLGYLSGWAPAIDMPFPPEPGVYLLEQATIVDSGERTDTLHSEPPERSYYYFDRSPQEPPYDPWASYAVVEGLIINDPDDEARGGVYFPFLLAGIDPPQESALTGLDQAIVEGVYLSGHESLELQGEFIPAEGYEFPEARISLPILMNTASYVDLTYQAELRRVVLPPDAMTLEEILARGGTSYLDTLPTVTLGAARIDGPRIYQRMFETIAPQLAGADTSLGPTMLLGGQGVVEAPGPLTYRESSFPFHHEGLGLELVRPEGAGDRNSLQYRASLGRVNFDVLFFWNPVGLFDIELLGRPSEVISVPLETYFPPIALLRYDEDGEPVEPASLLRPSLSPIGYLQSPPLILTTLDAARALRGEAAISAIRVRVGGILELTAAAQRKVEAVALEIARQTGLTVDVMAGSSPQRVLVHVPGIGYVEEQWIQKGVNLIYREGIQSGNWLLLGSMLAAGGLFTLDLTWAELVARRRLIALQKALGWRSRTVLGYTLVQVLLISLAASVLGTATGILATWLAGWQLPSPQLTVGLPMAMLCVCALAGLLPAWMASRVPPIEHLRSAPARVRQSGTSPRAGRWSYAWTGLKRRPLRSLLTGTASAFSAALITLMLAVVMEQRGLLTGTLLGEFILVHMKGFHSAIAGIGLCLAALSTTNGLLSGILERRREIGVLKAVGWRTSAVGGLFITEGALLGLAGGLAGALLGALTFLSLYRSMSSSLAAAMLVAVSLPGLVGGMAALYPAHVASKVSPAAAVRDE